MGQLDDLQMHLEKDMMEREGNCYWCKNNSIHPKMKGLKCKSKLTYKQAFETSKKLHEEEQKRTLRSRTEKLKESLENPHIPSSAARGEAFDQIKEELATQGKCGYCAIDIYHSYNPRLECKVKAQEEASAQRRKNEERKEELKNIAILVTGVIVLLLWAKVLLIH